MKHAIGWILCGLPLLLGGCLVDGVDCTTEARGSVTVTVTDWEGEAVPEVEVTYEANGEAPVACDGAGTDFVCGWEVAGDLLIWVEAEDFEPFEELVFVPEDECHVQSQILEVILQPDD
jgi:hypothetical protein